MISTELYAHHAISGAEKQPMKNYHLNVTIGEEDSVYVSKCGRD